MKCAPIKGQVVIYIINSLCYYEIAHDAAALRWGLYPWQQQKQEDHGRLVQGLRPTDHISTMENNLYLTINTNKQGHTIEKIALEYCFDLLEANVVHKCSVN